MAPVNLRCLRGADVTRVAILGYASVDYVATVDGEVRWGWTSRIASRPHEEWPRPGGCPFYVARPLARAGFSADVVTWIGDDDMGGRYVEYCRRDRVGTRGIYAAPGAVTLITILLYNRNGDCACLVDFGSASEIVTSIQEDLIREADTVVVTVGPSACSKHALDLVRPHAKVVWVAKNDPTSFPPELRVRLGQRSNYIFCNGEERALINEATLGSDAAQVIVETHGADPILVCADGRSTEVAVAPLRVGDATGAGDTLAGGTLAALLGGEKDPLAAVRAGACAAHELLQRRGAGFGASGSGGS